MTTATVTAKKSDLEKLQDLPILIHGANKMSEKEIKHFRELGTYEFMNLEEPGLSVKFAYGNAKKKHNFLFFHGGKYTLPKFIARHMESKCTPMWSWRPDGLGGMKKEQTGSKSRFQMREIYTQ